METISLTAKFTKASGRKGSDTSCRIPANKKPESVSELQALTLASWVCRISREP